MEQAVRLAVPTIDTAANKADRLRILKGIL
jgi:hypothetical protein